MAGDWTLAVDFGSAFTAAAVAEGGTITDLVFDGRPALPSTAALDATGQVLTGWEAIDWGRKHPHSVLWQPKREVAAGAKARLDGITVLVADLVAAILDRVRAQANSWQSGRAPSEVILCHPAKWTSAELAEIAAAAAASGIPDLAFAAEPIAAARHYLGGCPAPACARGGGPTLSGGGDLVICDFGAGLDITVIRRGGGRLVVAGRPVADDELGGDDLDERLMDLLADRAYEADPRMWDELAGPAQPEPTPELVRLRSRVTQAREALSGLLHTDIKVPGYSTAFRITRREFEAAAKPELERLATLTETAITTAGLSPAGLSALALAGAVSRTPAVSDVLASRLGVLPVVAADPKVPVAHGALLAGAAKNSSPVRHYRVFDPDNDDWLNT